MKETISFEKAMEFYKEWVSYFRETGDPSGCERNNSYSIPLKAPSDVQEGEIVTSRTIGLVALTSKEPENGCDNDQVLLYINTANREGYACMENIKPFCKSSDLKAPLPSSKNISNLFTNKYLNQLTSQFKLSLAEAKKNPLFGSGLVFANGITLLMTACVIGFFGGFNPTNSQ